jgi:hypothetical protein
MQVQGLLGESFKGAQAEHLTRVTPSSDKNAL